MSTPTNPSRISHQYIWRLAIPMIIANIFVPLLGMVDTAMVGHLDTAQYLGAIALGTLIFTFLFWGFGFLRMATTGLTAQALGQDDAIASERILSQGLTLALIIATVILLLQQPIAQFAFHYLEGSEQVKQLARDYFAIRIWSTPAILANYVAIGWLIGKAQTRSVLAIFLLVNISNIILDVVFVYGLAMDINGVALASVIAEYIGLIAVLFILKRHQQPLPRFAVAAFFSNQHFLTTLKLQSNIFIRTLILISSFAFFTVQGAKQGDITLAANTVLLNFIAFMAFVLDGLANAIEIITGKAIGKKDRQQLKNGIVLTAGWSFFVACCFSTLYYVFGSNIIYLLTDIPAVIKAANDYLIWLVIAPIIAVWSYFFDGVFIGATKSKEMRNTMIFASLLCYLPSFYLLQPMGNHGLWLALLIFLAARGLSQAIYLPAIIRLR